MATAKKKAPTRRAKAAPKKKAIAKKSPARKKAAAKKKPVKLNVFRNAINEARDQLDEWVDTAKLKAKLLLL